ncbi:MAG: hypothetical protein OXK82_13400 [Deltaproteobacteria bacterium]|nr:hypothetical protein [Deltaproteobacteria bacterium]
MGNEQLKTMNYLPGDQVADASMSADQKIDHVLETLRANFAVVRQNWDDYQTNSVRSQWWAALHDLDYWTLRCGCYAMARTNLRWPPSPGEFRAMATNANNRTDYRRLVPHPDDALGKEDRKSRFEPESMALYGWNAVRFPQYDKVTIVDANKVFESLAEAEAWAAANPKPSND